MKKIIITCSLLTLTLGVKAQYVSLTAAEVKTLKTAVEKDARVQKEFAEWKQVAEKALNEAPNPIEKVTSQGLLQGNPAKTASLKAVADAPKIYALALIYRLYGNKDYLNKAQEYLTAWAKINKATGDPIDETKLEEMFTGYDLIRNEVSQPDKQAIDTWLESIAHAEIHSVSATPTKSTSKNNWNSHRIKIITQIAYAIHADKYRDTITAELEKQLAQNLYPDGSSFDFAERDALHYHIYTLEPLLKALIVISRANGKNYYSFESPTKSSVQKSVQFLVPFVTGEKTHGEFANSKVKFDRERAANGEKGYVAGAPFKQRNGIVVLSLAAYYDPSLVKTIQQVAGNEYYDWQLVLNQVRQAKK
ncbi:alginate lyase family protein [Mucilaginibacter sp. PAMB04274]|uniref:alginate lyase family protein n=1 Tax=Mucilaginibacter sp. PAMB04274 TaxID=3138568 RepID=UPI0031F6CABD